MKSSLLMMALPKLRKLLSKPSAKLLLQGFAKTSQFSIHDEGGNLVWGEPIAAAPYSANIVVSHEPLGRVDGNSSVEAIAALVTYLAHQEIQAKNLANEALAKYEEINFLYEFSHKLTHCESVEDIAELALSESNQLISASGGSVLLLNPEQQVLEVTASWGDVANLRPTAIPLEQGIIGSLFSTGKAEIINDVPADERYQPGEYSIQSMISAPIQARQHQLGMINLFHSRPFFYTANELRLLVTTGEQAGVTLENLTLLAKFQ